jgi:subtilisin family serine protease
VLCRLITPILLIASVSSFGSTSDNPSSKISSRLLSDTANGRTAEALIVLTSQADLSKSAALQSRIEKGTFALEALRSLADRTQAPIRKLLEERGIAYQSFYVVNAIKITADRQLINELAQRDDVASVDANPMVRTALPQQTTLDSKLGTDLLAPGVEWNVARVNAPQAWAMGYKGQGRVVGSSDTGVKWDHPALKVQYRGWNGSIATHAYNWHDATSDRLPAPSDPNSHGTFTTSEMVGDDGMGNQVGVAPAAKWIACRNMDRNGDGTPAQYIECFQWMMAPYPDGHPELANPKLAPDVINNSWACPSSEGCTITTLLAVVNAVKAAGIFPVMAAGNSGPNCSTVSDPPEFYASAFSVGATDYYNAITMYSSRGPVTVDNSGRLKPDLTAPGDNIRAAVPYNNSYQGYWSGTSMAAPHVSGAIALLWQAKPSLKGNVDATASLLKMTATQMSSTQNCGGSGLSIPNNVFGYGMLNIYKAIGGGILPH